ncbi:hypothetical protein MBLNU230_g6298t1 [Neophaeotheca triangularis]
MSRCDKGQLLRVHNVRGDLCFFVLFRLAHPFLQRLDCVGQATFGGFEAVLKLFASTDWNLKIATDVVTIEWTVVCLVDVLDVFYEEVELLARRVHHSSDVVER